MRWKTIIFSIIVAGGLLVGCGSPAEPFVPLSVSISGPDHVGFFNPTDFQAVITGTNAGTATVEWTTSDSDVSLTNSSSRAMTWEPNAWIEESYTLKLTVTHADEDTITKEHEFTVSFCSSGAIDNPAEPCGIQNLDQLRDVAKDPTGHYVQLNDIDASATSSNYFVPIGGDTALKVEEPNKYPNLEAGFTGTFDGGGYSISKLHVVWPETVYVGLFGALESSAVVKDVHLIEAEVVGHSLVGGLAGVTRGTIHNSSITNSNVRFDEDLKLCGEDNNKWLQGQLVGGLTGRLNENTSVMRESYVLGTNVFGCEYIGGLAGGVHGVVTDTYVLGGTVRGDINATHVGGFTGFILGPADNRALVERSFTLTNALVGDSPIVSAGRLRQSFWSSEYPGAVAGGFGTNLTAAEFADEETFTTNGNDWDFDTVWQMGPGASGFDATALPDLRNNPR